MSLVLEKFNLNCEVGRIFVTFYLHLPENGSETWGTCKRERKREMRKKKKKKTRRDEEMRGKGNRGIENFALESG